ncbi:MAG: SDR family oxidoreductase [Planctomycetota bacterium]|nr:SDR family oxidoreductase [Planctomycetota bacterium]
MSGRRNETAIVGMAGTFPGASSVEEFWRNLLAGVESVRTLTAEEVEPSVLNPAEVNDPNYVRAAGMFEGTDLFDAPFFGMSAREAALTDPQHRLILERAWEALEAAGYDPAQFPGRIGVFCGCGTYGYLLNHVMQNPAVLYGTDRYQVTIGTEKDYVATRIAYMLDLRGPALSVQAACSTSLVAIHLAGLSLAAGECDMALAGGVSLRVPVKEGHMYWPGGISSRDGRTRAFDADADGTMFTSGAGMVVLKRLTDALADGDHIHAVVAGSAVNNDGASKAGYTAPSRAGQGRVLRAALAAAGVEGRTISCVEAHGTATPTGDPIEVGALTDVLGEAAGATGFCALGTVKTNIGHTNTAAGVAGVIKIALSLEHKQLPASLNFHKPNPAIDFARSPLYVNAQRRDWPAPAGHPRRALVNSLGIGGTNACAVLEQAPPGPATGPGTPWQLLTVSARSVAALEAACGRLARHLERNPQLNLADVCFTLQAGRRAFRHRRAILCASTAEAVEALGGTRPDRTFTAAAPGGRRPVVFAFPGQAAEHVNMARDLYRDEPEFRRIVDHCAHVLRGPLGVDLREVVYPSPGGEEAAARELARPLLAHPAVFVFSYAMARLWMQWGVRPDAVIGYSTGAVAAACVAGVFSLDDALTMMAARGRLTEALPPGAMLAIAAGEEQLTAHLEPGVSLAILAGESHSVASGPVEKIHALAKKLKALRLPAMLLPVPRAYHSEMIDPIVAELEAVSAGLRLSAPKIPFFSTMTGGLAGEELTAPSFWGCQIRQPVRFAQALAAATQGAPCLLLETGPGQTLTDLVRRTQSRSSNTVVLAGCPSARDGGSARAFATAALGKAWLSGACVDWRAYHAGQARRRLPLPTYPFERQRYWIDPAAAVPTRASADGKKADLGEWFYAPSWKRLPPAPRAAADRPTPARWLLYADACGLGRALADRLAALGHHVTTVTPGGQFARAEDGAYTVRPGCDEDVAALLADLAGRGGLPAHVAHLWTFAPADGTDEERFDALQDLGYYSLLALAKALAARGATDPVQVHAISAGLHAITGAEALSPGAATLLGPCKVISQEYPHIRCRLIDLEVPHATLSPEDPRVGQCLAELTGGDGEPVTAWRGGYRWAECFEPMRLEAADGGLRPRGVYLITGGLGGIGLTIAEQLARSVQARLVLVGPSPLPEGAARQAWLASHAREDKTSRRLEALERIEQLGSEVMVLAADAADKAAMRRAFEAAEARWGAVHGVFHAAGVLKEWVFPPVPATGRPESEAHFGPKARGLFVLEELLVGRGADFCMLFSSISAVLGGLGYSGYAAGNAFLDAFAARANRTPGQPRWVSVNWDAWKLSETGALARSSLAALAMTPEEGAQAMLRILSARWAGQIVVSTGDLPARMATWLTPAIDVAAPEAPELVAALVHPRPDLMTAYAAPADDLQRTIAGVWQTLLGIDRVGVHDDFFELGGHSLLAIQAVSRLRKALGLSLTVKMMFELPTIAALAGRLAEGQGAGAGEILQEIEALSEADAQRLLAEEEG